MKVVVIRPGFALGGLRKACKAFAVMRHPVACNGDGIKLKVELRGGVDVKMDEIEDLVVTCKRFEVQDGLFPAR